MHIHVFVCSWSYTILSRTLVIWQWINVSGAKSPKIKVKFLIQLLPTIMIYQTREILYNVKEKRKLKVKTNISSSLIKHKENGVVNLLNFNR